MRSFIAALGLSLLLVGSGISQEHPQQQQVMPIKCGKTTDLIHEFKGEHYSMLFYGKTPVQMYMVFQNKQNKDWYIFATSFAHPETSCMIADGLESETIIKQSLFPEGDA